MVKYSLNLPRKVLSVYLVFTLAELFPCLFVDGKFSVKNDPANKILNRGFLLDEFRKLKEFNNLVFDENGFEIFASR